MYSTREKNQPFEINIPESLLIDQPIKEHGYPLKGTGYAFGLDYEDGKTYIDFILTSNYWAHIRVQCNEDWEYEPNGDIIFPPSWDTEEKRSDALLKAYRPQNRVKTGEKPLERQLSIFDFVGT